MLFRSNVQTWKAALTKVANLAGWDLKDKYEFTELHCKVLGFGLTLYASNSPLSAL